MGDSLERPPTRVPQPGGEVPVEKLSGFANSYWLVSIAHPRREGQEPYVAECEDIIAALGMTFDEGCEFKAIWRTAAARKISRKEGHDPVYDAEKRVHYATRSLATEKIKKEQGR